MKILLINPDYMLYSDPPLGLAYLAAYIRKRGFQVKILDQLNEKEILEQINKINPSVIGLPAVTQNYYYVKNLAKKIKKISNALLVLGGVHITTSPNSFENSGFDIAIRGEGEIPFNALLESIRLNKKLVPNDLKKIKGLLFRDNKKIINTGISDQIKNLDALPLPARDLLDMDYYTLPSMLSANSFDPCGAMMTSRGCPFSCKFCSSSCFWEKKTRFFSPVRVVQEIELLYQKYGYRKIAIYDDLFAMNKTRLEHIIKLLEKKHILGKIKFYVYGRADIFDEEIAKLLKKLNVVDISFGIESGSQKVLNYLKGKRATVKINENALKLANKYHLGGSGFFMIGSPYETKKDMEETYEFIKKNCKNNFIIYQTISFPGTEIWSYALKNKILKEDFYENKQKDFVGTDQSILLSKEISGKEFTKMFRKINSLHVENNKNLFLKKIPALRFKDALKILSLKFFKKSWILRKRFLKQILN